MAMRWQVGMVLLWTFGCSGSSRDNASGNGAGGNSSSGTLAAQAGQHTAATSGSTSVRSTGVGGNAGRGGGPLNGSTTVGGGSRLDSKASAGGVSTSGGKSSIGGVSSLGGASSLAGAAGATVKREGGTGTPLVFNAPVATTAVTFSSIDAMSDRKGGLLVVGAGSPGKMIHFTGTAWEAPRQYDPNAVGAPQIAGSVEAPMVVWNNTSGVGTQLFHYSQLLAAGATAAQQIGNATALYADGIELCYAPQTGKALVISTIGDSSIQSEIYDGKAWQPQVLVSEAPSSGYARLVRLSMDAQGRAAAIWEQRDGADGTEDRDAVAALFDGSTWKTTQVLGDPGTDTVRSQDVAVNADGKGFGVWGGPKLMVCPLDLGVGWGTPIDLMPGSTAVFDTARIAVNAKGQAILVWEQQEKWVFVPVLWASMYDPATGWTAPQQIHSYAPTMYTSKVAIDDEGRAALSFLMWLSPRRLWVAHYLPGHGFSSTEKLCDSALLADDNVRDYAMILDSGKLSFAWTTQAASGGYTLRATTATMP